MIFSPRRVASSAVTLAAALLLGERVGWRRRIAILAGFVGVLVIIRPGLAGFTPVSGLVLIGVLGLTVVVSGRGGAFMLATLDGDDGGARERFFSLAE